MRPMPTPKLYERLDFVELSGRYAGKWVALHPETADVLAAGDTLQEVRRAVASVAVEDPIITKVEEFYGAFVP
jgi:hypothetical protein